MLKTGKDIRMEYSSSEEIKRLRDSYVVHILDYVFEERERVFNND